MTEVKICGLTRVEDAEFAAKHGAWALGMIMWKGSKRYCPPEQATEIAHVIGRRAELVGVFVDAKLDDVAAAVEECGFTMIQLHGDEGTQYCKEVARRTGCRVIKAIRIESLASAQDARQVRNIDYYLADTFKAGLQGGTGETFDWRLLRGLKANAPLILSGGLTAQNVAAGIDTTHPFAVDVSSGVETSPGVKDHDKILEFITQARSDDSVAA